MIIPTAESSSLKADYNRIYVFGISLVAALGGLLFGYDWVVIGGAKPFFEQYFKLTDPALSGWANSCALIGCLVGAMIAGSLSERYGRKRLLSVAAMMFVVTSLGNALAHSFTAFVVWRMLGGTAIGLASSLSPMYISEVSPPHLRGRLVSINQLTIVIGILLAQFINWWIVRDLPAGATGEWIATSWYGQSAWRWMFGVTAIPAGLFLLGSFFVPESPRWLTTKGQADKARKIFEKIGGLRYGQAALAEVEASLGERNVKGGWRDLFDPRLRRVLVLGIGVVVLCQWSGINVIFNYAEDIFRAAGYDISSVLSNIAWTGSVNLAFTLVALGLVDRSGRRPLMLIGAAGLALIYVVMGWCYYSGVQGLPMLLLVLAAIGCYAMTLAPVAWVVVSEVFPNRIRSEAMGVAVTLLWTACFLLTYTFPILNKKLGSAGTFWLYGAICAAGFLFIFFYLPETKGKSLEEIEQELVK